MLFFNRSTYRLRLLTRAILIVFVLTPFVQVNYVSTLAAFRGQQTFPAPPTNKGLIYFANTSKTLEPLPFETGTTPLKTDAVAGNDKTSYIEVKGPTAVTLIEDSLPRFYLFVADEVNIHPPLIVRLTPKRGARRVTAMAQKGLKGYAIYAEEIVKPHYKVLSRSDGVMYLEITPREPLIPNEYAIIGTDLQHIATFRVGSVLKR